MMHQKTLDHLRELAQAALDAHGTPAEREPLSDLQDSFTPKFVIDLLDYFVRVSGEATVMRALLRASHDVIATVEGENAPECEMLMDLQNKIRAAYQGSI